MRFMIAPLWIMFDGPEQAELQVCSSSFFRPPYLSGIEQFGAWAVWSCRLSETG
jgi:hypothetical protein